MQALLLPPRSAVRSAGLLVASSSPAPSPHPKTLITTPTPPAIARFFQRPNLLFSCSRAALSASFHPRSFASTASPSREPRSGTAARATASSPSAADDGSERAKLAQVSKRLENTSRYFKRLGSAGFWGQLVCTVVAAVILSFSAVVTGKITSPVTFYATAGGIAAAFVSVFWSFGYIRLSERLRRTANEPAKAPPRADVVKSLKNGIVLNILGMGAAILGMQATVGLLVAKALTSSAIPYYQGISPGQSPVLALDVFLVQASANTILSHFLGLAFSLELLRSVTLPYVEAIPVPKPA
ncbi:protein TIC 21, chloroplastic [Phoenix dactylifera]|uniref:Protein TIC 21, chloroplastic n=1 Tax=Phoenix dactylifera TaxID=42345 RepID=A0A8B7CHZ3_PHODC|nr:protein TIC 21, chloroplastic [Phoenix dactylifera]